MAGAMSVAELSWDESLVDLRCSVVVIRQHQVLVIHRDDVDDWVLPGGRPRPRESLVACVRREAWEETGLRVQPTRCAFVGEVNAPDDGTRTVELVFLATLHLDDQQAAARGEPGARPTWVPLRDVGRLNLRPPIAGHLRGLGYGSHGGAAYLGNLWRPPSSDADGPAARPWGGRRGC
jgi:8-oxo-dGTP diphosphatase